MIVRLQQLKRVIHQMNIPSKETTANLPSRDSKERFPSTTIDRQLKRTVSPRTIAVDGSQAFSHLDILDNMGERGWIMSIDSESQQRLPEGSIDCVSDSIFDWLQGNGHHGPLHIWSDVTISAKEVLSGYWDGKNVPLQQRLSLRSSLPHINLDGTYG